NELFAALVRHENETDLAPLLAVGELALEFNADYPGLRDHEAEAGHGFLTLLAQRREVQLGGDLRRRPGLERQREGSVRPEEQVALLPADRGVGVVPLAAVLLEAIVDERPELRAGVVRP